MRVARARTSALSQYNVIHDEASGMCLALALGAPGVAAAANVIATAATKHEGCKGAFMKVGPCRWTPV
jgi:hypothetical protein